MGAIYLEVEDEITTAAARIRESEPGRVVLVLPAGSRLGTSRINFRLLAREADALRRTLVVVSPEAQTRSLAVAAGLAAHPTVGDADAAASRGPVTSLGEPVGAPSSVSTPAEPESEPVRRAAGPATGTGAPLSPRSVAAVRLGDPARPGRGSARSGTPGGGGRSRPAALAASLIVGIAALAAVGWFAATTLLPSATVRVTIAPEPLEPVAFEAVADPAMSGPDSGSGRFPAELRELPLSASDTFPATGVKVAETAATGQVTWRNCDPTESYAIPAGTIVRTRDRIGFRTVETIFLPVAPLFGCERRIVGVQAVVDGTSGNVAARAITVLPGIYNAKVMFVANAEPTSGGTRTETPQVTKADVSRALKSLEARLEEAFTAAVDGVAAGATGDTTVYTATASYPEPTASVDPASLVGTEVPEFELGLAATGSVLVVDAAPIQALARARLEAAVPSGRTLVAASIVVEVGEGRPGAGLVVYPVTVRASVIGSVDPEAVRAAVGGRPLAEARAALVSFGGGTIEVWPDWVTTLPPPDSDRLVIEVAADASAGTAVP